jgi:hypothetical protein
MSGAVSMPVPPALIDDQSVREQYVDGPVGINFANGNIYLTFATMRADHSTDPPGQYRAVTTRLVMPLAGALDVQKAISGIIGTINTQGLIKPILPGPQTRQ